MYERQLPAIQYRRGFVPNQIRHDISLKVWKRQDCDEKKSHWVIFQIKTNVLCYHRAAVYLWSFVVKLCAMQYYVMHHFSTWKQVVTQIAAPPSILYNIFVCNLSLVSLQSINSLISIHLRIQCIICLHNVNVLQNDILYGFYPIVKFLN